MTAPYTAGCEVVVELGVGANRTPGAPSIWSVGQWGRGAWSGYEPLWREVDCARVISVQARAGRERSWDAYGIGTLTFEVVNEDGVYSWNPAAAPTDATAIRPGDGMRVGVLVSGFYYPLARAYVETIEESYEGVEIVTATIAGQDALAQLNRAQIVERAPAGTNDHADERIARLLDAVGWPAPWRLFDPGTVRLLPTVFAGSIGDEMQTAADSDGGSLFADRDNRIVFRSRVWEYQNSTEPVLAFGADATADICPLSYEVARDVDDLTNQVIYAAVGGQSQVVADVDSQKRYGLRTLQRNDLICAFDGDVLTLARNALARRSAAPVVVRAVTFEVFGDDPIGDVAQLELGDLVTVSYVHPRQGWTWTKDLHVQSIEHTITADSWTVRVGVDDLAAYVEQVDRWDGSYWGAALWHA